MKITFGDWTYELVRARIVEAAETLIAHPAAAGPRMAAGAMAEEIARASDRYGDERTSYRRTLSPGALSRMEETWTWINSWLPEGDRKLVYDYGFIKTRKGQFLEVYLRKNDMVRRTFERKIRRCCQVIADNLNRLFQVRFTMPSMQVSQNGSDIAPTTVSSEKCATHWRAPDAKPQIDPAHASVRVLDHREIRARHSDQNRSLRAGK